MAESNFEKDLEKLEKIVEELEEGGLTLDQSLKRFEEGIKLSRRCDKALSTAEKRIEILLKNADGELEAQPFAECGPAATSEAREGGEPEDDSDDDEDDEEGELLF
jgi:exodeoxyribonuclease VII small subunit